MVEKWYNIVYNFFDSKGLKKFPSIESEDSAFIAFWLFSKKK